MPDIFLKDQKLKLIEYGSSQQGLESIQEAKDKVVDFLQNIVKK